MSNLFDDFDLDIQKISDSDVPGPLTCVGSAVLTDGRSNCACNTHNTCDHLCMWGI